MKIIVGSVLLAISIFLSLASLNVKSERLSFILTLLAVISSALGLYVVFMVAL